jgi:hypothetical protein
MRKILLLTAMLAAPFLACGQTAVSAIGGENGYKALRASLYYSPSGEDFYIEPFYAFYQDDDLSDGLSRAGARAGMMLTDRIEASAEGSLVFKKNGYTSWNIGADGRYYFIKDARGQAVSSFYAGAGLSYGSYNQDEGFTDKAGAAIAPFDIGETRGKLFAGAQIWRVNAGVVFSQALAYSDTPQAYNAIWFDLPYFVTVERRFVDSVVSSRAFVSTEYLDFGLGHSFYKYKGASETSQSVSAGATLKIFNIGLSGSVEVRDFAEDYRKTYFSFAASTYF